jgi:hypothetical protein
MQANNGELLEEINNSNRTFVSSFPVNDVSVTFPYEIVVHHKFPFRRDDRPFEEKVKKKFHPLLSSIEISKSLQRVEHGNKNLRFNISFNHLFLLNVIQLSSNGHK